MQLAGILKPEYIYQPQKMMRRIFQLHQPKDTEFIDEILPWGMKIRVRPLEEHGRMILKNLVGKF